MTTTAEPTTRVPLDAAGRATLFTEARTANTFSDQPVSDEELADIWELARWAPTSANVQPLRLVYVRTPEGKERLVPHMNDNNRAKAAAAPPSPSSPPTSTSTSRSTGRSRRAPAEGGVRRPGAPPRGGTVQRHPPGGLLPPRRARRRPRGGPMLGFDAAGLDAEFFSDTSLRTVLVVNIGHPGENPGSSVCRASTTTRSSAGPKRRLAGVVAPCAPTEGRQSPQAKRELHGAQPYSL